MSRFFYNSIPIEMAITSSRIGIALLLLLCSIQQLNAQNALVIPPVLNGPQFNLTVQSGTTAFYPNTTTPTYGVNGNLLAPTLIMHTGDQVNISLQNTLNVSTTMHWHGLHVSPMNDGGPHSIIQPGATWNPQFQVMNAAGTFWYHPHGAGQTDPQVSKGLAGMIIVHDAAELALPIPHTYGVDDVPVIIQSKAFDVLQQIAIATEEDTALMVNGTIHPYYNAPSQVLRLRLLNGSSMRVYNIGFSNNKVFYQIATDAGLRDSTLQLTRLRLAPGERSEVLIDLSGMNGQSLQLIAYNAELPNGFYGAAQVGYGTDTIMDYPHNFLNGQNFELLNFQIGAATSGAVYTIPTALVPLTPFTTTGVTNYRSMVLDTLRTLAAIVPTASMGPFGINQHTYDMDTINFVTTKNAKEIWTIYNKTLVAHPFHIHGMHFFLLERSGQAVPKQEQGKKDVVLVYPNDSVKFITQWLDFADDEMPYMYHCHMLHHEDDGMMGQFIVQNAIGIQQLPVSSTTLNFTLSPNPASNKITLSSKSSVNEMLELKLFDWMGQLKWSKLVQANQLPLTIPVENQANGIYLLQVNNQGATQLLKFTIQNK